jgi:hypothetical protein
VQLSIITLGNVHAEALEPLTPYFTRLEQLVLDVAPRDPLAKHRPELNRAIDAASADWLLILREREAIDAALAAEIGKEVKEARVWGFRVRSLPWYADKALRIGNDPGEVRLFHKRHYLRFANRGEWDELTVQGTVLRLENALRSITFESANAHRDYLGKTGVPHSNVRRALLFVRYALSTRTLDTNTLRYLWIEAGFDKS